MKTFKDLNWQATREDNGWANVGTATFRDITFKVLAGEAALHLNNGGAFWNGSACESFDIMIIKNNDTVCEQFITSKVATRASGFSFWANNKNVLCNISKARITQLMKKAQTMSLSNFGTELANTILAAQ